MLTSTTARKGRRGDWRKSPSSRALALVLATGLGTLTTLGLVAPHATAADAPLPPTSILQGGLPANDTCGYLGYGQYVKFTTGGGSTTGGVATTTGGKDYTATYSNSEVGQTFKIDSIVDGSGQPVYIDAVVGGVKKAAPLWQFDPQVGSSPVLSTTQVGNFTQFAICVYPTETFKVAKKVTDATGNVVAGATDLFDIHVTCTLGEDTVYDKVLSVGANQKSADIRVPMGAICTATDSATGYEVTSAKSGEILTSGTVLTVVNQAQTNIALDKTVKDADGDGYASVGEKLTYTFTVTNKGVQPITNLKIDDKWRTGGTGTLDAITCLATTLAPAASTTCTAVYTVGEGDAAFENIANVAFATSDQGPSNPDDATIPVASPKLIVDKSVTGATGADGKAQLGDTLTWTITVTNPGNVTLTNVVLTDSMYKADELDCGVGVPTTLAPKASFTCTATHKVDQADIDAQRQFVNVATADSEETPEVTDTVTVDVVKAEPAMTVVKSVTGATGDKGTAKVGDTLKYTIVVTNTGKVTLTGVTVKDPLLPALTCEPTQPGTLAIGATMTCTGSYVVTQANIDAQKDIRNVAVGDSDQTPEVPGTVDVPVDKAAPALTIDKSVKGATGDNGLAKTGDVLTYTIVATNTGNVSLTGVVITDPMFTELTCTPAQPATLGLKEWMTCTGSYTVTAADVEAGKPIVNVATADSDQTTPVDDTVTVVPQAPRCEPVIVTETKTETTTKTETVTAAPVTETVTTTETVTAAPITVTNTETVSVTETKTVEKPVTTTETKTVEKPVTTTETKTVEKTVTVDKPVTTTATETTTVDKPVTVTATVTLPAQTVTTTVEGKEVVTTLPAQTVTKTVAVEAPAPKAPALARTGGESGAAAGLGVMLLTAVAAAGAIARRR